MPKQPEVSYLQISSITHAYRGQQILQRHGIFSQIQRDSRYASPRGCGYQLRLRRQDPTYARQLLLAEGVRVLGGKDGDGNDLF